MKTNPTQPKGITSNSLANSVPGLAFFWGNYIYPPPQGRVSSFFLGKNGSKQAYSFIL
ncbi:MAG: hypothetical protein JJV97_00185 [SAR324 cluster bacterium]|nr:hypothetical protein [SAR324 cluster bacterium]